MKKIKDLLYNITICCTILQENIRTLNTTVTVFDPTIIKLNTFHSLLPNQTYKGGLESLQFTMNCKHISDDGVSRTAVRVFESK